MSDNWIKDPFFWTGTSLSFVCHYLTNMTLSKRLNYRLHILPFHMFALGYILHTGFKIKRKGLKEKTEKKELHVEFNYLQEIGMAEGKFLENRDSEVKEIFKTLDF